MAKASQMFSQIQPREQFLETALTAKKNTQVILLLTATLMTIPAGMAVIFRGQRGPRFYHRD